jgi:hypothetical protein
MTIWAVDSGRNARDKEQVCGDKMSAEPEVVDKRNQSVNMGKAQKKQKTKR